MSKNKDSCKNPRFRHIKIFILLGLAITGGFSGVFLSKYNLKEKLINFRLAIYDYFTRQSVKDDVDKDNESIIARFFSESDYSKRQQAEGFDNLKQYLPQKTLPAISNYCHNFLIYGNPSFKVASRLAQANLYLCRDGYVVGYNYATKQASWVAFRLTKAKIVNNQKRKDKFRKDTDVPFVYRATLDDYLNSGYDKGHLASNGSMNFSKKSADESFLLSNISPQKAMLNRRGWQELETDERIWANMYNGIYIYTGPIYKKQKVHKTIGDNKVAVPDYFFKIIYVPSQNKAIAFVMPNFRVDKTKIASYRTSIKNIQKRTGLHFLTNIENRSAVIEGVSPMWDTFYLCSM